MTESQISELRSSLLAELTRGVRSQESYDYLSNWLDSIVPVATFKRYEILTIQTEKVQ